MTSRGQAYPGDPHGQRQVAAQLDELGRRIRLAVDTAGADNGAEQSERLVRRCLLDLLRADGKAAVGPERFGDVLRPLTGRSYWPPRPLTASLSLSMRAATAPTVR